MVVFALFFSVSFLWINRCIFVEFKAGESCTLQTESFVILGLTINVFPTFANLVDEVLVALNKLSSVL
jgi:hypothetical protein